MFRNTIKKIREKKYLKAYKELVNQPFCFQYECFCRLNKNARKDFIEGKISAEFYIKYFIDKDFREILATL